VVLAATLGSIFRRVGISYGASAASILTARGAGPSRIEGDVAIVAIISTRRIIGNGILAVL